VLKKPGRMAQFIALARRNYDDYPEAEFTAELLELEAERARQLYEGGVYRQIWSRGDHPGAVLLIEAASLADAQAALESLPLKERGMLLIDVVVPLTPYRGFGPRG
jgi:muconolactone delta-isomerase